MIKLSKLSDYAVVVLSRLAAEQGELLTTTQLALDTGVPEPTVSKVIKLLAKHNIVTSARGSKGGYMMDRAPHTITVAELIVALEGPIALTTCIDPTSIDGCSIESLCPMRGGWHKVNTAIQQALESLSLADLLYPVHAKRNAS